jgi:predicted transcriptional regulator
MAYRARMSAEECANPKVSVADAERVRDVMVSRPKTLPADASVADLRAMFANPSVLTALLVDGDRFAGAVERDDLPAGASDVQRADEFASRDVITIELDASTADAVARLDRDGDRRLIVLDTDGATLRGLLCLAADRTGFCQSG